MEDYKKTANFDLFILLALLIRYLYCLADAN